MESRIDAKLSINARARRGVGAILPLIGLGIALAASSYAPPSAAQAANQVQAGKRLYMRCQACHTTAAGQPHKVGPNLHGFLGKKAATRAGFRYSPAMVKSGLTWDDRTLDAWLQRPSQVVRGTTMAFPGIARPEDRAALIAYLKSATK